ncbi:hypothetical protein K402DRAFT_455858 [Aulographum hederae CBS 113979]|uniref:Uncharacterized protein n=1 Tax=Aulographum hederae CBS 113979 TaxID=1176131 RepID=A0A6G1GUB8_9PEZI|nr:hypothetical protein K402DRAFT_455858 [Aulographum hederae CBS 113979]
MTAFPGARLVPNAESRNHAGEVPGDDQKQCKDGHWSPVHIQAMRYHPLRFLSHPWIGHVGASPPKVSKAGSRPIADAQSSNSTGRRPPRTSSACAGRRHRTCLSPVRLKQEGRLWTDSTGQRKERGDHGALIGGGAQSAVLEGRGGTKEDASTAASALKAGSRRRKNPGGLDIDAVGRIQES